MISVKVLEVLCSLSIFMRATGVKKEGEGARIISKNPELIGHLGMGEF